MHRVMLAIVVLSSLAMPAGADMSENECARRFEACAKACTVLDSTADEGCLGRCVIDNGCAIEDDKAPDGRTPASSLPDSALPADSLPNGRLPDTRM